MSMDFDPTRPIYLQIMEAVKTGAVRGEYQPGEQLPSVRELAVQLHVNPNTLARAYSELERDGFITTRRGEGSFVTEDTGRIEAERRALAEAARDRFAEEMRALDMDAGQVVSLLWPILKEAGDDRG